MYNQEKIVDDIIMGDLIKLYPQIKNLIKMTPPKQLRGAVLSVLNKERRYIHTEYKKLHQKNKVSCYLEYTDEIVFKINDYVTIADVEKEKYAEVMTPICLVEDILDTLPKSVWSNPNLKWLDPCNGVGTFPSIIIQRLMKGLEEIFPKPKDRYKHIIENMIYVCELQARNMYIFHCVFDKPNIYDLKTFYGSFLSDEFNGHMKNAWGIDKFDIIIGNPPYQENAESGRSKGGGKGGDNNLWSKFVLKCLDITDTLCFIHPPSFLSPSHNVLKSFNDKGGISYIKILEKSPFEGASTQACYYIWKRGYNKNTKVDGNQTINLKSKFIPNSSDPLDYSIYGKFFNGGNVFGFIRTCSLHTQNNKSSLSKEPTSIKKYKMVSGSKILYTSKLSEYHNDKKVIVSRSGYLNPQYDNGNTSVSESNFCCMVKSASVGNSIINLLNTKLYKYVLNKSKFSGFFHGEVLKNIPQVSLDREWTDKQLYKHFNLSQEEINLIESQTK